MKIFLLFVLLIGILKTGAQSINGYKLAPDEKKRLQELFENDRVRKFYPRFTGTIQKTDSNIFKFDTAVLEISSIPEDLKTIFTEGILYPGLFIKDDILTIADLYELKFLEPNLSVKRFKFLLWTSYYGHPWIYFMELTNTAVNKTSGCLRFLMGQNLHYY